MENEGTITLFMRSIRGGLCGARTNRQVDHGMGPSEVCVEPGGAVIRNLRPVAGPCGGGRVDGRRGGGGRVEQPSG